MVAIHLGDCIEDSLLDNGISTSMTLPYHPAFLLLIGLHLFGSAANIEECMQKTQPIKYGQEVCFNGMLMLKASSSGLELGNCAWSLKGPRASITYLPSTVFVSAHALDCDYNSLKENDVILFSDFSSLNVMDEDNENLGENAMLCDDSVSRYASLFHFCFL
jgi:integrator complex subunit 9